MHKYTSVHICAMLPTKAYLCTSMYMNVHAYMRVTLCYGHICTQMYIHKVHMYMCICIQYGAYTHLHTCMYPTPKCSELQSSQGTKRSTEV